MVVSDKYGGSPRASIGKRTAIYVASFAVGSLLIAGLLSLVMVNIAEAVLPKAGATKSQPESVKIIGKTTNKPKARGRVTAPGKGSKAHSGRAN